MGLCLFLYLVVAASCTASTPSSISATAAAGVGTCSAKNMSGGGNSNNHNNNNIFGVPEVKLAKAAAATTTQTKKQVMKKNGILHEVRGGDLHEPETLQEVEALVLNAATLRQLVVIDFSATWCGPCKAIAPLYEELSEEFSNDVVFLKVDVDENPDTAAKYSVSAMPTFIFISDGEVVDRLMGANPAKLRELIEEHM